MKLIFSICLLWKFVCYSNGANILVFLPLPFKSHFIGFEPYFMKLSERGHNVTILTPFPKKSVPINYKQIFIDPESILKGLVLDYKQFTNYIIDGDCGIWATMYMWTFMPKIIDKSFQNPILQEFIEYDQSDFDLVLVSSFYQEMMWAMGHKYNAPVISLVPLSPVTSISKWHGNPVTFSYIPDPRIGFTSRMNFVQRAMNFAVGLIQLWIEDFTYIPIQKRFMDKYMKYPGSESRPPLEDMLRNTSISLVQSDMSLLFPRPYLNSYIEVSGMHVQEIKNTTEEMQKLLDDSKQGIVYFSLGSLVDESVFPPGKLQIFFDVFEKIPQIVFWKLNNVPSEFTIPKNVIIQKWFPQLNILAHENCKLFITHGGLHSYMEAVHFAVPLLGIPFFADQTFNLLHATEKNIGILMDISSMTAQSLLSNLNSLINESRYADAAKALSKIYHDKPAPPIETAIYWTEYVLRHKGASHLQVSSVHLAWYQSCLLDVIAFVLASSALIFYIIYKTIKQVILVFKKQPKEKMN